MTDQIWSWALTIVGATCFYLAGGLNGRKVWWAWYIGLFAQVLWFTYAVFDLEHRAGFLAGVAIYGYVYVRNCVKWTREHRAEKRAEAQRSQMIRAIAEKLDVPYELIKPQPRAATVMRLSRNPKPPTIGPKGGAGDSGAAREERP